MKISKAHEKFARILHFYYDVPKQDVLNHPENYLGPNWEAVINFWLYLDTLSKIQLVVVEERYCVLSDEERSISSGKAWNVARDTTRYANCAGSAAYLSVSYEKLAAEVVTRELLGLDKLLEQGHQPVFFPLFLI